MIIFSVKTYTDLSKDELYALLQLRSEVFVVEQDCVYQDIDGKDQKSIHVLGFKNNVLVAYTRIFSPGDYFENASIGRVIVKETERENKYGYDLMKASIDAVRHYFKANEITISAQTYLKSFYVICIFTEVKEESGITIAALYKSIRVLKTKIYLIQIP